ncbi:MAG TPA: hypothetical protein VH186_31005 [Chloroflexia bacterium]|nr:hypothetical protein [Chloroflexia bacterium]
MKNNLRLFSLRTWTGPAIAVLLGFFCFCLALLPVHKVETDLANYAGGKTEQDAGINFIWTAPDTTFIYRDVPRFAPIYLNLKLLLDRPAEAPPAQLQISEKRDNQLIPLATVQTSPGQNGWRDYTVKIPALKGDSDDELQLNLKSNGFKVSPDPRNLGVRVSSATLSISKSGLLLALVAQPLLPATILMLLGMAWWCALVGFRPLEMALLLAPTGFMAGAMANLLVYSGWWELVTALLLLLTAYSWQRWGRAWLVSGLKWRPLLLLMLGIGAFCGFFVLARGLPGDVFYFREVLAPMLQYGPIGVYPHDPRLNYPPGAVYQLYFYGILAQPFHVQYNQSALKLLMGSALLFIPPLLWLLGIRSGVKREHLARSVMLFGFCLSMLFVPAVWIQADGWLYFLMVAALALVIWGRPYTSAATQAFGIIYKAQSWLLLPLYALTFQWRFGWLKAALGGVLCLGLVIVFGGLGFGFNYDTFKVFWDQPAVSGESDWGGIRTFNLMNMLGYDQIKVPQPLLGLSYVAVGIVYVVVLLVCWRRNNAIASETAKDTSKREARSGVEWFLAAAFILTFIFFFWVKMHERYLYFGLGFLLVAAFYRRDLYRLALLLNIHFTLNLLYAYLPERRDPIPNNFFFWRHFLHADIIQSFLAIAGMILCAWMAWFYFRPTPPLELDSETREALAEKPALSPSRAGSA